MRASVQTAFAISIDRGLVDAGEHRLAARIRSADARLHELSIRLIVRPVPAP